MEEGLVSSFNVRHLNPKEILHRVSKADNDKLRKHVWYSNTSPYFKVNIRATCSNYCLVEEGVATGVAQQGVSASLTAMNIVGSIFIPQLR